jgi:hypothetical protein
MNADDVVARLAMLARARGVPGASLSWHDLLFDGTRLRDPSRPDQALLLAVAELEAELGRHLDELPTRMRAAWLARVLGIQREVAEPDVVPLVFTAQPGRTPVVVAAGTEVRAKDAAGGDRRYRTTEPLTVHGFTVTGVRAYRALRDEAGAIADHATSWADPAVPFAPFTTAPAPPLAPHRCRFADPILATSGRAALTVVTIDFGGDAQRLTHASWFQSTAHGPQAVAARLGYHSTSTIHITLVEACEPDPTSGEPLPWLEVRLREDHNTAVLDAQAMAVVFTAVRLQVDTEDLPPDAAYANDASLDLAKEFHPFGPAAGRGDAFYVRSAEAFAKPLDKLGVTLVPPPPASSPKRIRDHGGLANVALNRLDMDYQQWMIGVRSLEALRQRPLSQGLSDADVDVVAADLGRTATLTWQCLAAGTWHYIGDTGHRVATLPPNGVTTQRPASGFSEESSQGGKTGRAIRAVLVGGDLGWTAFQSRVAAFAAAAVAHPTTVHGDDLVPPAPVTLAGVLLYYRTVQVRPVRITATDGWAWREATGDAPFAPFRVPVTLPPGAAAADAATLDLGLALPDSALGGTVSVHLAVEPADVGATAGASVWQVATPSGWRAATVADGTHGLRQSGLLHVVAPPDWQRGAAGAGDPGGTSRWLRLFSTEPGRLGALLAVVPDVAAADQTGRPDPVDPGTALRPGDVKGLVGSLPAIKKVANLTGRRGRGAERDEDFLRRASGYHRHRDRVAAAWDYEEHARLVAPEVAAVRCLPHTCPDGGVRPGSLVLVVVPDGDEPMPMPTVALAERIESALRPRMPLTAHVAVVAPVYRPVTVTAHIVLVPGIPSLSGRQAILDGLESFLRPARRRPVRFGRPLFASEVVAFLESLSVVDRVATFQLTDAAGAAADPVVVDAARGLVASSGTHGLTVEETL